MPESKPAAGSLTPVKRLALRGVTCPINFVRTKIALEQVAMGDCIEVTVDGGQPALNVPRSAKLEGHDVLADTTNPDSSHTLVIRKKGERQAAQ